jgi:ABC-type Fe3+-hydroxamate transport system substrate-binding protein
MSAMRSGAVGWLLWAALPAGCANETASRRSAVVDDFGDSIVAAAPPARIVSLSPATTEILFALGAGRRLVGRTHWDRYPDSALAVPDLGNGMRPNVEAVLAARPDLVVLYASDQNRDAARALRQAGVAVVALRNDRLADFGRTTLVLGRLSGDESRAAALIDSVTRTLDRVRAATRGRVSPSLFLVANEQPLMAIGAGSFLSELVEIAGGRNVFGDLAAPSPQVSFEEVLRRNPDIVMGAPALVASIRAQPRWRRLPAVGAGRLLITDTTLVILPGVRLGQAAVSIARLLHPGAVP